jgi:hypothetical protein
MPYDFDSDEDVEYTPRVSEDEFDTGDEGQVGAEAVVASLTQPVAEKPRDRDPMSEAVRRIELAGYYRELINAPLFEQSDQNAIQVEQEIRSFVEERMQVLLGLKVDSRPLAPVVKPQFSEEEVASLKVLAKFSASDLRILKMLISSASRRIGALSGDSKTESPLAGTAVPPTVRKRPVPPGTPAPAAKQPSAPVPIQPRPAAPMAAAPTARPTVRRPGARTAPVRRAAGEPTPPPPQMEEKRTVVNPNTGKVVEITNRRVQRPVGAVPFPTDRRQFEAMSHGTAAAQVGAFESNPESQQRSNNA